MLPVPIDQTINQRIARSSLAPVPPAVAPYGNLLAQGVFIENPWGSINTTGIGKPKGPGTMDLRSMNSPVDGKAFKAVLTPQEISGLALGEGVVRPPRANIDKAYLEWGAERSRQRPYLGVCDGFTCITIAMLVATNSPLAPGLSVEWFGMTTNGLTAVGHAITVVGRTVGSNPAIPGTWGNNCVVVDQWYALQTNGPAAMFVNGAGAHAAYVKWLTSSGNALKPMADFTVGAYPSIRPPLL